MRRIQNLFARGHKNINNQLKHFHLLQPDLPPIPHLSDPYHHRRRPLNPSTLLGHRLQKHHIHNHCCPCFLQSYVK